MTWTWKRNNDHTNLSVDLLLVGRYPTEHVDGLLDALGEDLEVRHGALTDNLRGISILCVAHVFVVIDAVDTVLLLHTEVVLQCLQDLGSLQPLHTCYSRNIYQ